MKPVLAEDISKELDDLRSPVSAISSRVRIQTFGNFDIFVDNVPLVFFRAKAKETLAYVVSKNGGSVTVAELAAVILGSKGVQPFASKPDANGDIRHDEHIEKGPEPGILS